MPGKTLYDKLWESHVVRDDDDGTTLIYIDRHLVQEVSSPQAFEDIQTTGRSVHRPETHLAVADHGVPTTDRSKPIEDPLARAQIAKLIENTAAYGIKMIPLDDQRQGIVHVVGPELGFTQPGITLVCGDSHTSTHGAFGALAFGIGSSECHCVLTTQCLRQSRSKNMAVDLNGTLPDHVTTKDVILSIIGKIGTSGATGYAIEFRGEAIKQWSMEARMTLCNMAIEAGARVGLIAPDEVTVDWLKGKPYAPAGDHWPLAVEYWKSLESDADAVFDQTVEIDLDRLSPFVTWGTSPQDALAISAHLPTPEGIANDTDRARLISTLDYMGLEAGMALCDIAVDVVFIGSCTNGRIEDLRAAAAVVRGKTVAACVEALVVPGSGQVKRQAEAEGLDKIFLAAGFQWREPGCSMCVGMNPDRLKPGQRSASTSNRNFEGRQGPGGRTHLMSPAMAAAAAVRGHLVDVRELVEGA